MKATNHLSVRAGHAPTKQRAPKDTGRYGKGAKR